MKPRGTKSLKLNCAEPLSASTFNPNLRRYTLRGHVATTLAVHVELDYSVTAVNYVVGRCKP
jgi:hypothetical protein